ncbi:hypothetical protein EYF80_029053 [Liparis tanakae]|uniref:Uncharacterized protein n=1 Tax=Liparis tanakae TaxID=230148 RepID=A0A4Z2H4L9_9TELE|nr:hypothetical protein EYF80_029053 [Liparis tanakae]
MTAWDVVEMTDRCAETFKLPRSRQALADPRQPGLRPLPAAECSGVQSDGVCTLIREHRFEACVYTAGADTRSLAAAHRRSRSPPTALRADMWSLIARNGQLDRHGEGPVDVGLHRESPVTVSCPFLFSLGVCRT